MSQPDAELPSESSSGRADSGSPDPAKINTEISVRRERRAKQADRYLERARSGIDTAGKISLTVLITTSAIWFFRIEPALQATDASAEKIRDHRKEIHARNPKINNSNYSEIEQSGARDSIRDRQKEIDDLKNKFAEKVNLELLGFKLDLSLTQAPYVWSGLLLWLVAYLAWTRLKVLRLCAKALRIQVAELGLAPTEYNDFVLGTPWWLKPPPFVMMPGSGITRDNLFVALGWESRRRSGSALLWAFAVVALALQIRFCWLEAKACRDVQECGDGQFTPLHAWQLMMLTVGLLVLTCWALWFWFRPSVLSDSFDDGLGTGGVTRRDFFAGAAPVIPALVLLLILPRRSLDREQSAGNIGKRGINPRFVRRHKADPYKSSLPPGFHKNPRTSIIHWISTLHTIRKVAKINEQTLLPSDQSRPVILGKEGKPRVHLATASVSLRAAAEECLRAGKVSEACDLLVVAISHNERLRALSPASQAGARGHRAKKKVPRKQRTSIPMASKRPDFGIYDLLANLAVRHDLPEFLKTASVSLQRARLGYPANSYTLRAIDERLQKWENPASPWYRKRQESTKEK